MLPFEPASVNMMSLIHDRVATHQLSAWRHGHECCLATEARPISATPVTYDSWHNLCARVHIIYRYSISRKERLTFTHKAANDSRTRRQLRRSSASLFCKAFTAQCLTGIALASTKEQERAEATTGFVDKLEWR